MGGTIRTMAPFTWSLGSRQPLRVLRIPQGIRRLVADSIPGSLSAGRPTHFLFTSVLNRWSVSSMLKEAMHSKGGTMSEHPNIQVARRGYEAFSRGDIDTLDDLFSNDVVWHVGGRNPLSGDYEGKETVFGLFGRFAQETGGTLSIDIHDILANDEHLVVLARVTADRGSKRLDQRASYVHHVNDKHQTTEFWALFEDSDAVDDFWS